MSMILSRHLLKANEGKDEVVESEEVAETEPETIEEDVEDEVVDTEKEETNSLGIKKKKKKD